MKALFQKYREIIMYLIFGVLTTVIGFGTYTAIMLIAEHGLGVPMNDKTAPDYLAAYISAQVIHWIVAVLFAFFTNRAWVFTDADRSAGSMPRQLILFSGSRLLSLLIDIVVTYGCIRLLSVWIDSSTPPKILGFSLTAEILAKLLASVLVIIANYIFSKLLVFKKKPND
jgi:putative flippase GtrA